MVSRVEKLVPHSSHWGAFTAVVRDGRLVSAQPFEHDPDPSPLLESIPDMVYSRTRVPTPMVRRSWLEHRPGAARARRGSDEFVKIGWDHALELVGSELARIVRDYGNQAILGGSYGWSSAGRFHHARTQLKRFLNCLGGFTDQLHNYSYAAALALLPHVVGTSAVASGGLTSWAPIVEATRFVVAFGGLPAKNVQVESGGIALHTTLSWLRAARQTGIDFVNVSPNREDAPEFLAAEWLPIRPNTDMAFMLGLAYTLLSERLHDQNFLDRYCTGFERFARYLNGVDDHQPKTAAWAEAICGIPAPTIQRLARRMAAERTMVAVTWSLQRADHGEQPYWMAIVLAAMLGQIGLPGGGFGFGYANESGIGTPRLPFPSPDLPTGTNPTGSYIPVARVTDALLKPGQEYEFNGERRTFPQIRLVYWAGGNPFHHHQDLNRLVDAWQRPETVIVHEPWWTATARHADIVLPATTTLERNDIGASGRDRYLIAMKQAIEPVGEARSDFAIFSDLAQRFNTESRFTEGRDEMSWVRHLYQMTRENAADVDVQLPDFETFWSKGLVRIDAEMSPMVLFSEFRADPDANPLKTPSGRIEIFSETIDAFGYDDCPGHPMWLEPAEWLGSELAMRFPLHLISNQPRNRLHGQFDPGRVSARGKIGGREACWINPSDAKARGICDGDIVRLYNQRGSCLAGALLTDAIRPGVVQLSTGAWFDPHVTGGAKLEKHGNPNVLTPDRGTSRLGQGPSAHSSLVEVERFAESPPPVTAFDPPEIAGEHVRDGNGLP